MENEVPQHLSFVLDGNRRWARSKGLPSLHGHKVGESRIYDIIKWCRESGIKYLTTYAFSTENWNRPPEELHYLFNVVFPDAFTTYLPKLMEGNIKVNLFGSAEKFPEVMRKSLLEMLDKTANNTGLVWNLCLNYGGRDEITRAVAAIVEAGIEPEKITEETVANHLYSAGMPDPDMMIRTGGDPRVSNFLLWQQAYTELYFTPKTLPEFERADFDEAIKWYAGRERRMGR